MRDYGRQRPYRAVMDGVRPGQDRQGPTDWVSIDVRVLPTLESASHLQVPSASVAPSF